MTSAMSVEFLPLVNAFWCTARRPRLLSLGAQLLSRSLVQSP